MIEFHLPNTAAGREPSFKVASSPSEMKVLFTECTTSQWNRPAGSLPQEAVTMDVVEGKVLQLLREVIR